MVFVAEVAAHPTSEPNHEHENENGEEKRFEDLVASLPSERSGWIGDLQFHNYGGFWLPTPSLRALLSLKQHWKPRPTDVILASHPKSGTTWLKALLFAIINRRRHPHFDHTHPLFTSNPHQCAPLLDFYAFDNLDSPVPDVPLCSTHIPYSLLPQSVLTSDCPIIYVYRDPKDVLVSLWHFDSGLCRRMSPSSAPIAFEEAFEKFCRGFSVYGPIWDHVAEYRKASLECPDRVMLLEYEHIKTDPLLCTKRLAQFVDHPFSWEEERNGLPQKITDFCSFQSLSNLEVNSGASLLATQSVMVENRAFFRKGEVGDYKNYLTPEMAEQMDRITKCKFGELGLKA